MELHPGMAAEGILVKAFCASLALMERFKADDARLPSTAWHNAEKIKVSLGGMSLGLL